MVKHLMISRFLRLIVVAIAPPILMALTGNLMPYGEIKRYKRDG